MKNQQIPMQLQYTTKLMTEEKWHEYTSIVATIHQHLHELPPMTGWLLVDEEDLQRQLAKALPLVTRIQEERAVLVVIAIGGSALGTRAILEQKLQTRNPHVDIVFVGDFLDPDNTIETLKKYEGRSVYLNYVSKSGTTLEPTLAFQAAHKWLQRQFPYNYRSRTIFTTDASNKLLLDFAQNEGYTTFTIPADVGGRFSLFTMATLFPLQAASIDVQQLLAGVKAASEHLNDANLQHNSAYQYAVLRHQLYEQKYAIELLTSFQPNEQGLAAWWQQLFAESEGKDGKGLFPASICYPEHLHSVGQFIQQGSRCIAETFLTFQKSDSRYLEGSTYSWPTPLPTNSSKEMNEALYEGVLEAHIQADIPVIEIMAAQKNEYTLGYLHYFFMKACAMSAYLLQVNPFNQPGVEVYKASFLQRLNAKVYSK